MKRNGCSTLARSEARSRSASGLSAGSVRRRPGRIVIRHSTSEPPARDAPVQARGRLLDALIAGVAPGLALVATPSSLGASALFAAVVLRLCG